MNSLSNARVLSLAIACWASGLALAPSTANAQSWERFSGIATAREQHRGVAAVQFCAGGGHIAVGSQTPTVGAPPNTQILIERLDPNGNFGWRYTYDSGRPEQAAEVVEYTDGTGFAIVGTIDATGTPPITQLTISKLDCNGNMLWQRGYGPSAGTNVAWDLIRAKTGNGVTTFPGDLIALGEYTPAGAATSVVHVVRIRNNGALIWMNQYTVPGALITLSGRGIAEVDTPSVTDDLVVAGGVGNNASIFQINGDTGAFICGSQLPGLGVSRFNDIAAHGSSAGPIAPGFTPVGETRTAATALPQIFVASYRSTGCALQRQIHWGSTTQSETAQAVTTTLAGSFSTVPAGQLLIAGDVIGPFGTSLSSTDAWAHLMVPITLTPYIAGGYTGQRIGTQGAGLAGRENATGVIETNGGGYLVGASTSAWAGADPLHALTARLSFTNMKTLCSVPWSAPVTALTPNAALTVAPTANAAVSSLNPPLRTPLTTHGYCCGVGP